MSSAILAQCLNRISAIATCLQQTDSEAVAVELQQCLELLAQVQQQQEAQTRSHHGLEQALHKSQLCSRLAHSITINRIYGRSLEQLIDSSLQQIHSAFPHWRIAYSSIDAQSQLTVIQSLEPEGMPSLTGFRANLTLAPEYLAALRRGEPVMIENVANSSIVKALAEAMSVGGTQAVLDLPLKPCRKLVGLLCLNSPQAHNWNEHEIGAMIEIADYLSYALQEIHAQQEHRDSEAALHQANRELKQYADQLETANQQIEITLEELRQENEELISSRQETERQRQCYQDLFNLAPNGYLVTDTWGVIQEANHAAMLLLAALHDYQILNKPLCCFIPLEERRAFRTQLNQLVRLRQSQQFEIDLQPKQGMAFSAAITVRAIQDWQSEQVRFLWLIRDISDTKQAELTLHQFNHELEQRVRQRTAELSEANTQLQAQIQEREQAEQHIRFQARLLDAVEQAVIATDLQGNITYWNRFAEVLYGWKSDEVLGRSILEVTPASTTQAEAAEIFSRLQAGESWSGEFLVQRRDGTIFPIMITDSPIFDERGVLIGIVGISIDMTKLKQAETALRENEELFRQLAENIRDIFFVYSADLQPIYVSPAYEELWGDTCENLYAHPNAWLDRIHPEDKDRIISILPQAKQQNLTYEYRMLSPDGSPRWIRMRTFLVIDERGKVYRIVGIGEDFTDRKRAEEKLWETQQHLQAILNYSPTVIYVIDRNNNHLLVNRSYESLVSIPHENLIGKSIYEVWSSEFADAFAANNQQVLQSSEPIESEEVAPHADGVHTYITIKFPLYDANGAPYAVCGISTDISDRKKAEEAHRRSEARFRALMQTSPDIITLFTSNSGVFYQSPAVERILGYTPEEFLGELPLQALHPDDLEKQQAALARVWANPGVPISIEYRLRHKNGSWVWLEGISTNLLNEPDIQAFVVFSRDIRDRKKAEEELQANQRFIQKIADSSPNLLYLYDLEEQRNIYVNREVTQMLGYTPEEIQAMGQNFLPGLMHPDDWRVSPEKFQQIYSACDGEVIEFEYRLRHKNGEWHWLYSWDTVFTRNSDGKPTQILGTATDISDRKQLELALQHSEERFRTCVENLLDALAIFSCIRDATGQIVDFRFEYINPAGCSTNRMSREQLLGKNLFETLPPLREMGLFDAYRQLVETGKPLVREIFSYQNVYDGERMQLFFEIQAVKLGDGCMVTWRDITERKQAEDQIQASLKEKEVLLREIHHRVKNNLQVIHSLLKLQSSYTHDPKTIEMFHESQARIRSMALVHELLYKSQDLARIDFGSYIRTLVNQIARTYTVSTNAIAWEIDIKPTDIELGIDTALPCGLLINELVTNALKYAFPQGQVGQIRISLRACNNKEFTLVISDNGVGISADLDFRHTDSLGLQLVCGTTEQIGGTLELDRTQGTTFTIKFREVKYKSRR